MREAKDVFRILSPTAILGYGFPAQSLRRGLELKPDLIAVDAGSIDAGPYYLGADKHYVGRAALERDLGLLIRAALKQRCPLIIGSAGFSGANPQCDEVADIVRDIIAGESKGPLNLSIIYSDIDPARITDQKDKLEALGPMPALTVEAIAQSKIVGQMGIEPIITALRGGADIIVCGRAYDPAVFAALPIMQGFEPGLSYHVGKVLECGAIACIPGSGGDCLVAEIHRDGHAEFIPCNPARKCTPGSIASHSLYEKSRPDYFHLPGGILSIQDTRFRAINGSRTAVDGSRFLSRQPSIKLEGCRPVGQRSVSVVSVDLGLVSDERIVIYGRNGVEARPDADELGIVALVGSDNLEAARNVLARLRAGLLHYGYPGRISTAGNLAFPCSPSDMEGQWKDKPCCFFIAGSRDPVFLSQWPGIKAGIIEQVREQMPELLDQCEVRLHITDRNAGTGLAFIETCDDDGLHQQLLDAIEGARVAGGVALEKIKGGMIYEWTLYHLLMESEVLEMLFPIHNYRWMDGRWHDMGSVPCDWTNALERPGEYPDEFQAMLPARALSRTPHYALTEIADIIRSKNAGINEITWDVFFKTREYLDYAIESGAFTPANISKVLELPEQEVTAFQYRPAKAIKITARRASLAGNFGDRDVFGAQQHGALVRLEI